jgi:putative flippase GtrA
MVEIRILIQNLINRGLKTNLPQFLIIGVINTLTSYSIIFFSLYILKLNYMISNSIGYFFGLILSFFLNKHYNFKSDSNHICEFSKFILAFFISFAINSSTLYVCVEYFLISKPIAIIFAGVSYSVCFFIISKFYVFKKQQFH